MLVVDVAASSADCAAHCSATRDAAACNDCADCVYACADCAAAERTLLRFREIAARAEAQVRAAAMAVIRTLEALLFIVFLLWLAEVK